MTLRVVFRRIAQDELEEAAAWYEDKRSGLGAAFAREVEDAIAQAAEDLTRYPAIFNDVRRTITRRFPFSIYFRVRGGAMVVLAVFHGRRDPSRWQTRK